ncbi:MAG: hypothetical protein KIT18_10445, partial [Burkholderiales bacterium]|nr:hypothetical protein [Burkholderiales bacterium]
VRKGGERVPVRFALTPVRNTAGAHAGFLMVTRDMSETLAAQEQVRKLRAEVEAMRRGDPTAV